MGEITSVSYFTEQHWVCIQLRSFIYFAYLGKVCEINEKVMFNFNIDTVDARYNNNSL